MALNKQGHSAAQTMLIINPYRRKKPQEGVNKDGGNGLQRRPANCSNFANNMGVQSQKRKSQTQRQYALASSTNGAKKMLVVL